MRIESKGFSLLEAKKEVNNIIKVDNMHVYENMTPMLWGSFGAGKTESIKDLAVELESELRTINLSTLTPIDVRGIPAISPDGNSFKFLPPEFLPTEESIRFFDKKDVQEFETFLDKIFDLNFKKSFMIKTDEGFFKGEYVINKKMSNHSLFCENKEVLLNTSVDKGESKVFYNHTHKFVITDSNYIVQKLPVILFFDEINTAPPSTQVVAYEISLERKMGGHYLPSYDIINNKGEITESKKTCVIMAGNRNSDRGATHTMPMPLANRVFHIEIKPDVNEVINYFVKENVDPLIISYLKNNHQHIHVQNSDNTEKFNSAASGKIIPAVPSPRTWKMMSNYLKLFKEEKRDSENNIIYVNNAKSEDYKTAALMTVGEAISRDLDAYILYAKDMPDFMNELSNPNCNNFVISSEYENDLGYKYFYIISLVQSYYKLYCSVNNLSEREKEVCEIKNTVLSENLYKFLVSMKSNELLTLFISLLKSNSDDKKSLEILTFLTNSDSTSSILDKINKMFKNVLNIKNDNF